MLETLLLVALVLLVAAIAIGLAVLRKVSASDAGSIAPRLEAFEKSQERTERAIRDEAARGREEMARSASQQRQELVDSFAALGASVVSRLADGASVQRGQLEAFSGQLGSFAKASGERLDAGRAEATTHARQLREEVVVTLKGISETMARTMTDLALAQKTQLDDFSARIDTLNRTSGEKLDGVRAESASGAKVLREEMIAALGKLTASNEAKLEAVRTAVEGKLQAIQADNAAKLELMRATVEEKLQGTLEKRLGESFKQVSERLEQVHKGLGEMQVLANGVGDLKKVLTNVKTRGTWGEIQLGALLEQILTPEQYSQNVATRKGSNERVEFAVRLPGRDGDGESVWLPIDAKCPTEDYQRLVEAQDRGDADAALDAAKQLETRIKGCGRDIRDKYINPPATIDYAIMYLPTEGLYAEAIRRPGLVEFLQRECRVNICGPTTLAAMLNSLQMGFRSLAIQKRSSEVWQVLGAVKSEFGKFGDVLDKVHKKLDEASNTIDDASKRTRAIERKLRTVEELPVADAQKLLLEGEVAEA